MAYTDLTAHHSIAPYGGLPTIVETGGPYGGRYIQFDGASALQVSSMASFAVSDTEDFCVEVCVRMGASGGGGSVLSVTRPDTVVDAETTASGRWHLEQSTWRFAAPDGAVWQFAPGQLFDGGAWGIADVVVDGAWHVLALNRAGGVLTYSVDNVPVLLYDLSMIIGESAEIPMPLSGSDADTMYVGACPTPLGGALAHGYATDLGLAWVRYTRASRAGTGFASASAPVPIQEADPHWGATALLLVPVDASDLGGSGGGGGGGGGGPNLGARAADYLGQFQDLLPYGPAWSRDPAARLTRLLAGLAVEPARLDIAIASLVDEADPRTTTTLIAEYEALFGIVPPTGWSNDARRAAIVAAMVASGGQSRAYYTQIAAALGYAITIIELAPFTSESATEYPVYDERIRFLWVVTTASQPGRDAVLQAALRKAAPAHTQIQFIFT